MRAMIVIPTYWTGLKHEKGSSRSIYDHPTPMNGKSTLGRLLRSFRLLNGIETVDILVLGTSTHASIQKAVKERLQNILKRNRVNTTVFLFSDSDILRLHKQLERQHVPHVKDLLSLNGYSNIRNMSLFIPFVLGYDTIISIDDDELITEENSNYLQVVFNAIKKGYEGLAGFYTSNNNPAVVVKKHPWSEVLDKSFLMKQQLDNLRISKNLLTPTFFALGGNLVLTEPIFTQVPFDPLVSRGEDMDYVMNACFFNHRVYFHKRLFIEHKPPHHTQPEWLTLRKEIIRFTYQYNKLIHQKTKKGMKRIASKDMGFYPGTFLEDNIYERFKKMNGFLLDYYLKRDENEGIYEAKQNTKLLHKLEEKHEDVFKSYLEFQKKWQKMLNIVSKNLSLYDKHVRLFLSVFEK